MTYANGNKYIGNWEDDKRNGEGAFYLSDGRIIRGTFKDNKLHGFAEKIVPSGVIEFGEWINGKNRG